MRMSIPALALGLFSVAIVGALLSVNSEQPTLRPRPAGLYLLQADEVGPGFVSAPAQALRFDRPMLHLPDYYPEREAIPAAVLDLLGVPLPAGKEPVRLLEEWDWLELESANLVSPGGQGVLQTSAIFGSRPGASRAFAASLAAARAGGWADAAIGPPAADAAALLAKSGGRPGETAYLLLLRNVNLVQRVAFSADPGPTARDRVQELAAVAARKSRGQIVVRVPTPSHSPTPTAPEAWIGPDGQRPGPMVLREQAGPARCDWQDLALLVWGGATYVRDVSGRLAAATPVRFDANVPMPATAADTHYRAGRRELWVTPGEAPPAVYIRMPGAVERWPRLDLTCP